MRSFGARAVFQEFKSARYRRSGCSQVSRDVLMRLSISSDFMMDRNATEDPNFLPIATRIYLFPDAISRSTCFGFRRKLGSDQRESKRVQRVRSSAASVDSGGCLFAREAEVRTSTNGVTIPGAQRLFTTSTAGGADQKDPRGRGRGLLGVVPLRGSPKIGISVARRTKRGQERGEVSASGQLSLSTEHTPKYTYVPFGL